MSFIFGGDTGISYDDLQRKRKIAQALLAQNDRTPRNVGEGLGAIGRALAARSLERKADKQRAEMDAAWNEQVTASGMDPERAAILGRMDPRSRDLAWLQWKDQQEAQRRAAAARGASQARAAEKAAEEERRNAAISQALLFKTTARPGVQMGPTMAAADAGATSGADLGALQTEQRQPSMLEVMNALIADPNVDPVTAMSIAGDYGSLMPEPEKPVYQNVGGTLLRVDGDKATPIYETPEKPKDAPSSVMEYEYYVANQEALGRKPLSYGEWSIMDEQALNPSSYTQPVTPGQKAADEAFAKEYIEWEQGGGADMASQISQITSVADRLASGENLTGPVIGSMPDVVGAVTNPAAIDARETVENVVQRNLRLLLGAQFTEKEGERLISRAYNPRLGETENALRLRRLAVAMQAAAEAKQSQAEYFQENGTLTGWKGKVWTLSDFEKAVGEASDENVSDVSPFAGMSLRELSTMDLDEIPPEQYDAYEKALREAQR